MRRNQLISYLKLKSLSQRLFRSSCDRLFLALIQLSDHCPIDLPILAFPPIYCFTIGFEVSKDLPLIAFATSSRNCVQESGFFAKYRGHAAPVIS